MKYEWGLENGKGSQSLVTQKMGTFKKFKLFCTYFGLNSAMCIAKRSEVKFRLLEVGFCGKFLRYHLLWVALWKTSVWRNTTSQL